MNLQQEIADLMRDSARPPCRAYAHGCQRVRAALAVSLLVTLLQALAD